MAEGPRRKEAAAARSQGRQLEGGRPRGTADGIKKMNFSVGVISGRRKYDHISDVRRGLGRLSASELANYHTLTLMHKVLRHGEPEELTKMPRKCADVRDREIGVRPSAPLTLTKFDPP